MISEALSARGRCLDALPGIVPGHAASNLIIGIGCVSLGYALFRLVRARADLRDRWENYLLAGFSGVLGLTHFVAVVSLWVTLDWVETGFKISAAALAILASAFFWRMSPRLVGFSSQAQVADGNLKLASTIAEQRHTAALLKRSEANARLANLELEHRVAEKTAALSAANHQLTGALAERDSIMQALAATEAEFRASFESAAIGKLQVIPESGRVLRVNRAFSNMLGYEPEEMFGRPIVDFFWPEARESALAEIAAIVSGEANVHIKERCYLHKNGQPHWGRLTINLVRPVGGGAPTLLAGEVEDIDEQRKAAAALTENRAELEETNARLVEALAEHSLALHTLTISEEEFRASFEDSVVGKLQFDPQTTRIVRANRAFARMIGYEARELVAMAPGDFTMPEDLEVDKIEFARFLAGRTDTYIREKRYICKDGSLRWARVSGAAGLSIAYGRPKLMVAEVEDIDQEYRAREGLRTATQELEHANSLLAAALAQRDSVLKTLATSEEAFRASFEWAAVGKVQCDPHTGHILRVNTAFAAMLGYEPEEMAGKSWDLIWPEDIDDVQAKYDSMKAGDISGFVLEKRYRHRDGRPIWGRLAASLVRDPTTGEPTLLIVDVENTDVEHKARLQLQAAKQTLEGVVEERTLALTQRDILLREVYHRVKNNLQIIDSFLVMQARHLSDPVARAALLNLRRRVYALGLVHHQLMGSQNLRTFDVAPFLRELSNNIIDGGSEPGVTLSVEAPPMDVGLDFAIPLGLLVTELVTNALKHAFPTGVGNIAVILERAENGDVALIVSDDGQGGVDHPQIGGVRTNGATLARTTTGLGSSIIAGLVAQLRGTMTMVSQSGVSRPGTRAEIRVAAPVLS